MKSTKSNDNNILNCLKEIKKYPFKLVCQSTKECFIEFIYSLLNKLRSVDMNTKSDVDQKLVEEIHDIEDFKKSFATGSDSLGQVLNSYFKFHTNKDEELYSWSSTLPEFKGRRITQVDVEMPEGLKKEISQDNHTIRITGFIKEEKDFKKPELLDLTFKFTLSPREDINKNTQSLPNTSESSEFKELISEKIFEIKRTLTVVQQPCNMWSEIEPEVDEYRKSHEDFYPISENGVLVRAVSVRGRSHANDGRFRDDDFCIKYENNCFFLAVADGAGSAKYSREGSRIACQTVVDSLIHTESPLVKITKEDISLFVSAQKESAQNKENNQNTTDREAYKPSLPKDEIKSWLKKAVIETHEKIKKEAERHGAKFSDYATTLLLAVAKKIDNNWLVASYWIGDGALALYDKREDRHVVRLLGRGEPDEGKYSGETKFLTMENEYLVPSDRFNFAIAQSLTALFLLTDGISDPKFGSEENLKNPKCWDELWENELKPLLLDENEEDEKKQKEKLTGWAKFYQEGEHDDRTMVVLINQE